MAGKTISAQQLGAAIAEELTLYNEGVLRKVNKASRKAAESLRDKTQVTAPFDTGEFSSSIDCKLLERSRAGDERYVWYVKAPKHRITHFLVHGHMNVDGSRTPGFPFLHNAWETVRKQYEKDVEEAVRSD